MNKSTNNIPIARTVWSGTMWSSSFNFILKFVGFFSALIVISKLSVYEYGMVELILSALAIFSISSLPGLSNVVIADMSAEMGAGNLPRAKALILNYFYVQILFGIIAWALIFFGSSYIAGLYNANIGMYFAILSFTFLISPIRSMYGAILSVNLKFFHRNMLTFVEEFSKLVLLVVLVMFLHMGVGGVMWAVLVSQILAVLFLYPNFAACYKKLGREYDKLGIFHFIKDHGKWGIVSSYLNNLGQNIRLWIIKFTLGTEAVGLFSLALSLINHTYSLIPLSSTLTPIVARFMSYKDKLSKIITKGIKYQFAAYAITAIGALIFLPSIVHAFFPKYISSIGIFNIMLLSALPMSFASMITPLFHALKAQKSLFASIAIKTVFIIVITPLCIFFFGIKGLAIEFVLTNTLFTLERHFKLRKLLPEYTIRLKQMFTFDSDDMIILGSFTRFLQHRLKRIFK